ncbi:hypothetical protein GCM10009613_55090 [Pseudonocardia kongjuensis]|uniref:Monooxygenase n=1 Tax=Pseudonocardia kongjuensis TaxID=102227 RepID=A0ABN1YBR2_9PSEU
MSTLALVDCSRVDATALVDAIVTHVPGDEPAAQPRVIYRGRVMITEDDERFAVETDPSSGRSFVTRTRSAGPGLAELTVWQDGTEIDRQTAPWGTPDDHHGG